MKRLKQLPAVEFVIVGGISIALDGWAYMTNDFDFC